MMFYNTHGKYSMNIFYWKRKENGKEYHKTGGIDKHNHRYVDRRDAEEYYRKKKELGGW